MEIRFSISLEDYWRYNIFNQLKMQQNRNTSAISITVFSVLIIVWNLYVGSDWGTILKCLIFFLVCGLASYYVVLRSSVARFYHNDPDIFQEKTMIIDETGITENNATANHKYHWKRVRHILQDSHNIYIYLEGRLTYVIPKRFFLDEEEANRFVDLAIQYWLDSEEVQII